jgi:hypothetical protein
MTLANVMATIKLAADRAGLRYLVYSETPRLRPECSYPTHQHLTSEGLDVEAVFIDPKAIAGATLSAQVHIPIDVLDAVGIEKVRESFTNQVETLLCPDVKS